MLITGYLVPDSCKLIFLANIICVTFCTTLITCNMFLKILSEFYLALYYLIKTCLKIATSRSCCTSRNFFHYYLYILFYFILFILYLFSLSFLLFFILSYSFLGRAVARAPISGFVILLACLSVTVSFWRGFESSHWV